MYTNKLFGLCNPYYNIQALAVRDIISSICRQINVFHLKFLFSIFFPKSAKTAHLFLFFKCSLGTCNIFY